MHYLQAELYELVRRDGHIFDFLQQGSLDGIWYWDLENPEHEWMSEALWHLFGYDPAEMPHDPAAWQELIDPDDLQRALENFERHCADPDHPYDQIVRYRHKDGSTVTVRCRGIAIRDENGKVRRMLGAHTDLTELKRTEAALLEANRRIARERDRAEAASRAKSTFLATMSHEIRTPLNGVLGMASALAMTPMPGDQKRMVQIITESGARLLALLNDILDLSKIEAGETSVEPVRFQVDALCKEVLALHAKGAETKGVSLTLDASGAGGREFLAGAPRIRQVLVNLVSNALKFTSSGTVDIVADIRPSDDTGHELVLTVRDTGIGIDDDQKERIFEPFIQATSDTGVEFGGTGLGLAISRSICNALGGTLRLEDTPGGGATFVARFPVTAVHAAATPVGRHSRLDALRALPPMRLLVAEDNETNQFVLSALLDNAPVDLVFVRNGREALDMLETERFDAALIDIRMPVLNGIEVARILREREAKGKTPYLPLIAFTANVMGQQRDSYEQAGFNAILSKPVDLDDLADCLGEVAAVGPVARHGDAAS